MRKEYDMTRQPAAISRAIRGRIRSIGAAAAMLESEAIPAELAGGVALAIEHLRFVAADLRYDLEVFEEKYGLRPQTPHKGLR